MSKEHKDIIEAEAISYVRQFKNQHAFTPASNHDLNGLKIFKAYIAGRTKSDTEKDQRITDLEKGLWQISLGYEQISDPKDFADYAINKAKQLLTDKKH